MREFKLMILFDEDHASEREVILLGSGELARWGQEQGVDFW
jgi:hypothetical protein